MSTKYIILLLGLCLYWSQATAQQERYFWKIGLHTGVNSYMGDLSPQFFDFSQNFKNGLQDFRALHYGVSVEYQPSQTFGLQLLVGKHQLNANDRNYSSHPDYNRALNVQTELWDASLLGHLYFDNGRLLSDRSFFAPYLIAGFGLSYFDPYGDLYNNGQRYHYWSDNSIRDRAENDPQANLANRMEQDGIHETALRNLQTEKTAYAPFALHAAAGLGFKFRFGKRWTLQLQGIVRYSGSDFLDDAASFYRTNYPDNVSAYAANPSNESRTLRGSSPNENDWYATASLSVQYSFGRKPLQMEPNILYSNPSRTLNQPIAPVSSMPLPRPDSSTMVQTPPPAPNNTFETPREQSLPPIPTANTLTPTGTPNGNSTVAAWSKEVEDSLHQLQLQQKDLEYQYQRSLKDQQHTAELARQQLQHQLKIEQIQQPSIRQNEQQRYQYELQLQQQHYEHQLEVQRLKHALELEKLKRQTGAKGDTLGQINWPEPPARPSYKGYQPPNLDSLKAVWAQANPAPQNNSPVAPAPRVVRPMPDSLAASTPVLDWTEVKDTSATESRLTDKTPATTNTTATSPSPSIGEETKPVVNMPAGSAVTTELAPSVTDGNNAPTTTGIANPQNNNAVNNSNNTPNNTTISNNATADSPSPLRPRPTFDEGTAERQALQARINALNLQIKDLELEQMRTQNQVPPSLRDTIAQVQRDSIFISSDQAALAEELTSLKRNYRLLTEQLEERNRQNRQQQAQLQTLKDSLNRIPPTAPAKLEAFLKGNIPTYSTKIYFPTGKTNLNLQSKETLLQLLYYLKEYPNVNLEVKGFASASGSASINQRLSLERAWSVANFLTTQGLDKARLKVQGMGILEEGKEALARRAEVFLSLE